MEKFGTGGDFSGLDLGSEDWETSEPDRQSSPLDAPKPEVRPPLGGRILSGTQLRHWLITPEVLAEITDEEPKPSLLQRLLGRK
jgi:hypothetical protein